MGNVLPPEPLAKWCHPCRARSSSPGQEVVFVEKKVEVVYVGHLASELVRTTGTIFDMEDGLSYVELSPRRWAS